MNIFNVKSGNPKGKRNFVAPLKTRLSMRMWLNALRSTNVVDIRENGIPEKCSYLRSFFHFMVQLFQIRKRKCRELEKRLRFMI